MSRAVRYFKLIYIVAGILLSNQKICETVDRIQIAPRFTQSVEVREKVCNKTHATKNVQQLSEISRKKSIFKLSWYQKFYVFQLIYRINRCLRPQWRAFNLWTLPNLFIECSTSLICRTFVIDSDCDIIYK